ncbi:MAG: ABC transporter substrate-binding protein [Actinomycetota bacterium]
MHRSAIRSLNAALLGIAILAAACSGDEAGPAADDLSEGAPQASATTSDATTPADSTQPATDEPTIDSDARPAEAAPSEAEEPTAASPPVSYPRLVYHALGSFTQDAAPDNIFIAASEIFGEAVIALGITPSGRLDWFGGAPDPAGDDYGLGILERDVPVFGSVFAPDIETIVGTDPDLVLVFSGFGNTIHDQLEGQINVAGIDSSADWQEILLAVGDAVGRPDEAEAALVDYRSRLRTLASSEVGSFFAGQRVAVVTPFDDNPFILVPGGVIGEALTDAGIDLWDPVDGLGVFSADDAVDGIIGFSKELAGQIEADTAIVVLEGEGDLTPTREAFLADPVWASMPAIANGNVVFVTNNLARNAGPLTHYLFFDDLERAIAAIG